MPELDILHGVEFQISRVVRRWKKATKSPFIAQPVIFPRCFTVGTEKKPYVSCTVDDRPEFVHPSKLCSIARSDGKPIAVVDSRRAVNQPFLPLLGLQEGGELHVKARGKELLVIAGSYAFRFQFGLEGITACIDTPSFWELVSQDCPGANDDEEKSELMRSFIVPTHLTNPDARALDHAQTINVFAAFVGKEDTFIVTDHSRLLRMHIMVLSRPFSESDLKVGSMLWSRLWSSNHGPDWIFEKEAAERQLDLWRDTIIGSSASWRGGMDSFLLQVNSEDAVDRMKAASGRRSKSSHVIAPRRIPLRECIMQTMTENQLVFNGYGQHTACDVLHSLHIWPGMPIDEVCKNNRLFQSLKHALHTYACQFVSSKYRELCLSIPNGPAFSFNYKSDTNFINQFLSVYRKCSIRLTRHVYNTMAKKGLFNANHTIGRPYKFSNAELIDVKHTDVDVLMHKQLDSRGKVVVAWYSVIRARLPQHWYSVPGPFAVANNALHAGMCTTIGPASFYLFKQNQHDPHVKGKPGPKKKISNGAPGRPSREPRIGDLRKRDERQRSTLLRTQKALEDEELMEPPLKRRKIASRSIPPPPSDRVTRSRSRRS